MSKLIALAAAVATLLLLSSSVHDRAYAYLLLYAPGGGGVPCGATRYVLTITCNSVLAGSTPL